MTAYQRELFMSEDHRFMCNLRTAIELGYISDSKVSEINEEYNYAMSCLHVDAAKCYDMISRLATWLHSLIYDVI